MNNFKTLKELCTDLGVSRSAVQGYEKTKLVKATKKNMYGHLLYDEKIQKNIEQINFFQDIGLSIKEISSLLEAPKEILKSAIKKRLKNLNLNISKL